MIAFGFFFSSIAPAAPVAAAVAVDASQTYTMTGVSCNCNCGVRASSLGKYASGLVYADPECTTPLNTYYYVADSAACSANSRKNCGPGYWRNYIFSDPGRYQCESMPSTLQPKTNCSVITNATTTCTTTTN